MNSHISPSGSQMGNSPHFIHREIQAESCRLMHRCHINESNEGHIGYSDLLLVTTASDVVGNC